MRNCANWKNLLDQGAPAHGFPNELWTAARVAQVIHRHFGVTYHPDYVRRLLRRRLGWTSHKPQRRARERNDKEVERWKADEFPRILREAWRRKAHVAFLDESGFMLMPLVRRTLARRGQRVFLHCSAKHDRISAISCVTLSPQAMHVGLVLLVIAQREFPRRRGRGVSGVPDAQGARGVDGGVGPQQHPQQVQGGQSLVGKHTRKWWWRTFPPMTPMRDPDEWVWSWAKYGKLCNLCPADVEDLFEVVWNALEELKHQPGLLASFVMDAGVPLCL